MCSLVGCSLQLKLRAYSANVGLQHDRFYSICLCQPIVIIVLYYSIGGKDIQTECDSHVDRNGPLLEGNVFVSHPGQLPCSMIIHAVGPRWKGGNSDEENHLFDVVNEALIIAGTKQAESIAMPAISTGIFQYPLREACKVILDAIKEFYAEGHKYPFEIHLVDSDARTVNIFHETLLKTFGEEEVQTVDVAHTQNSLPDKKRSQKSKLDTSIVVNSLWELLCKRNSKSTLCNFGNVLLKKVQEEEDDQLTTLQ